MNSKKLLADIEKHKINNYINLSDKFDESADVNYDNIVNVIDAIYIIYLILNN